MAQDRLLLSFIFQSEIASFQAVIVAEARLRSGSLITCERAMEEGRDVFAIPGNILDGKSAGCHHLIQEGAKLVTSGQDILDELKYEL